MLNNESENTTAIEIKEQMENASKAFWISYDKAQDLDDSDEIRILLEEGVSTVNSILDLLNEDDSE